MLTVVMLFLIGGNPQPVETVTDFPDMQSCEEARPETLGTFMRGYFKRRELPPPLTLVCVERYRT